MKFGTDRIRRQLPRQELQAFEEAEVFFDPARDFDPEAKRTMLEDLEKGGERGWDVMTDNVEYFYALFGDEFRNLHVHERFQNGLKEAMDWSNSALTEWERRRWFKETEKYLLLFPGEQSFLDIGPKISKRIVGLLQENFQGDPGYVQALFWRKLFFPNQPNDENGLDQEWKIVCRILPRLRKEMSAQGLWRHLAYLRLVFPDKDVASLITPADKQVFRRTLRELSLNPLVPDSLSMDNRAHYASLAWSGTIASAEKVEITADGRILFEMPKRSIQPAPPLPLRPTL